MDFKMYWFASEKRMMQINNYKCKGSRDMVALTAHPRETTVLLRYLKKKKNLFWGKDQMDNLGVFFYNKI